MYLSQSGYKLIARGLKIISKKVDEGKSEYLPFCSPNIREWNFKPKVSSHHSLFANQTAPEISGTKKENTCVYAWACWNNKILELLKLDKVN